MQKLLASFIIFMLFIAANSFAQASDFPRPASIKKHEANVRAGPGEQYPILWVFNRQGWPVEVLAEYQNWYKIRDLEGEEGWVYSRLISSTKTAVIKDGEPVEVFHKAEMKNPILKLESGVVVEIQECNKAACHVKVKNYDGWILSSHLQMLGVSQQ